MRVVFLGTPDFSVLPLKAVYEKKGVELIGVVCNKDKPVGRKRTITPPPVKVMAESLGVPVYQYDKIRVEGVNDLKALKPDLMITCAFGQILSQEILDIAPLGVINIHASLLPKFRGASPIQTSILAGEKKTGVTIMKTDIGIDTGDIICAIETDILETETAGELFDRLSLIGAKAIDKALDMFLTGKVDYTPQDEEKASHTKMIKKEDAFIDFNENAQDIVNKVRAFNPSPIAFATLNGEPFKIYKAEVCAQKGEVGKVIKSDVELIIGAKDFSVKLLTVQKFGGKAMDIKDFLRGNKIELNSYLSK